MKLNVHKKVRIKKQHRLTTECHQQRAKINRGLRKEKNHGK
jgi:hypothetical protein